MSTCGSCGARSADGKKFCTECGAALTLACAACGAPLTGGEKFCGECGAPAGAAAPAARREAPAAERRLVSVLFADLVGFTTLSESRDAEEVRELLSRYFDTCRRLIELYGGTVEKFIGDAVMAVWGTPTATEDDAERAVRAALDLVAAVSALGDEVGAVDLRARAGVLTGEAAVTLGAAGEGMVAGDLVNTASRVQSAAEPGTVMVGEATRRTTEAAIAYEPAGSFDLKGKEEPVAPLAGAPRRLRRARSPALGRARGAVRRSRERAAPDEGALPCLRRRVEGAPRLGARRRRNRQVAARLGVLQVLRRDHRERLLAPGPLSRLRGRCHVLGARRHDQDALPHRRGRGGGPGAREAQGDARRAPAGRGRAPIRRAEARAAPRSRRCRRGRPPGALCGVAALLRAARRRRARGARVRGRAVGGCEPPRLRRVPARVVARPPHLRRDACASGAARAAPDVGGGPAQLHVSLARAAAGGRDAGAPGRARARAARGAQGADSRPCRGCPAVRGRDRANAARSRTRRAGRAELRADGLDRDARGPGDAPCPDRRPSRRPQPRGAPTAPGRRGAREDLHAAGDRSADRIAGCRARRAPRVACPQGGARAAGRPELARARPVRIPAGPRPPHRLRDALEARADSAPPRRRGAGRRGARRGRGG